VILIDGHQMPFSKMLLSQVKDVPVVVDAGSWKPGFDKILRKATHVIASADFLPPGCRDEDQVIAYLKRLGVAHIAVSHGARPIRFSTGEDEGWIDVPKVGAADTMGAGDILHGAFCRSILDHDVITALTLASEIASFSCRFVGTRAWIEKRT